MPPRRFSLDEAEALLPRLTPLLEKLRELKHQHELLRRRLAEVGQKMRGNGHLMDMEAREAREAVERTAAEMNGLASEIQQMGCELKDVDLGLVDFRTDREGREVYLCWKLGEERIAWWHELHTGFASRQPL